MVGETVAPCSRIIGVNLRGKVGSGTVTLDALMNRTAVHLGVMKRTG